MGIRNFFDGLFETKEHVEQEINTVIIQDGFVGTSGTEVYAGYYDEEYLDKLKGTDRAKEFDKMRRSDTQIKMNLSAIKNPIRKGSREIVPANDKPESLKHARLCEKVLLEDIDISKFISEALTCADFGHVVFERTYKVYIDVPVLDKEGESMVLSSYIGFKQPGWRSPKTLETWNFNHEKEFTSITQQADGDLDSYSTMSAKFLTIITLDQEGDDLEGQSLLRPCYGSYWRKDRYLKLNAIGIEKSMPIPTAEIPPGAEGTVQFTRLKEVLQKFTTAQQNYITYPAGWNVQLSNGTAYDPAKVETSIDNEDKRMTKAFLANFLELGGSGSGSYALSNDLSDFFLSGLDYIVSLIEKALNDMCVEITTLNFGKQSKYPTFKITGVSDKAGEELAKILDLLVKNKVIIPDKPLEESIRKRLKLTPISEDDQRNVDESVEIEEEEVDSDQFNLSEKVFQAIKNRNRS